MAPSKVLAAKSNQNATASREIDAREEVARFDMPCGIAAIARPLKKGGQRTAFIKKQPWNGGSIGIRGISPDDHDLGVLLAFLLLAQQNKPTPRPGKKINGLLPLVEQANAADDLDVVTVFASYAEIRRILGIKSSNSVNNAAIWQSLCNLSTVVIDAKDGDRVALTHLILHGKGTTNDVLCVTLCYRLTKALMGIGSYGAVDMKIFRELPKGATRILYVWLASWLGGRHATPVPVGVNRLVEHVWGVKVNKTRAMTLKDRRRVIKNALQDIASVSQGLWVFNFENDNVSVQRTKL